MALKSTFTKQLLLVAWRPHAADILKGAADSDLVDVQRRIASVNQAELLRRVPLAAGDVGQRAAERDYGRG